MKLVIREYNRDDFDELVGLYDRFQQELVEMDRQKRFRTSPGFGQQYLRYTFEDVEEHQGQCFVALDDKKIIGVVVGIIRPQSRQGQLEEGSRKIGRVEELFVEKEYRKKNVATHLMEYLEHYFHMEECDTIALGMLYDNEVAKQFYKARGYQERYIDFIKPIHSSTT